VIRLSSLPHPDLRPQPPPADRPPRRRPGRTGSPAARRPPAAVGWREKRKQRRLDSPSVRTLRHRRRRTSTPHRRRRPPNRAARSVAGRCLPLCACCCGYGVSRCSRFAEKDPGPNQSPRHTNPFPSVQRCNTRSLSTASFTLYARCKFPDRPPRPPGDRRCEGPVSGIRNACRLEMAVATPATPQDISRPFTRPPRCHAASRFKSPCGRVRRSGRPLVQPTPNRRGQFPNDARLTPQREPQPNATPTRAPRGYRRNRSTASGLGTRCTIDQPPAIRYNDLGWTPAHEPRGTGYHGAPEPLPARLLRKRP